MIDNVDEMATVLVMANERFATLLRQAIADKSRVLGSPYSLRDLDRDSGVHFTYGSKLATGERRPSRATVLALSRALSPYLPVDEALLAAGHAPASEAELAALDQADVRWFASLPPPLRRQVKRIVQAIQESMVEEVPDEAAPEHGRTEGAGGECHEQGA